MKLYFSRYEPSKTNDLRLFTTQHHCHHVYKSVHISNMRLVSTGNRLQIKTLRSFSSKSNQTEQILGFAKPKDESLRANHLESLHSQIWHRAQSIFKNIMEEDW